MSTEDPEPSEDQDGTNEELNDSYQTKLEIHQRDRHMCLNCRKSLSEEVSRLDADHIVPEGAGGSSLHTNLGSLCRECHEAKHGEREIAPTIRFMSTGEMSDEEFRWFRHFWDEIFPALTEAAVGRRVEPLTNLDDNTPWQGRHIPIGFARFCEKKFVDKEDIDYAAKEAHHYW